jgi:hypothetical protein
LVNLIKELSVVKIYETRRMKYLSKILLGAILGLSILTSCNKKEGCTDKSAENYDPSAERENGTCILQRTKFLGLYQVNEAYTQNGVPKPNLSYTTIIRPANDNLTDVFIESFHDKYKVRARVNGNSISLISGTMGATQGSGTLIGNTMTISSSFIDYAPLYTNVNSVATYAK